MTAFHVEPGADLLRLAVLYIPVLLTVCVFLRIDSRQRIGLFFALWWNIWAIHLLNACAVKLGFWSFTITSGAIGGLPADFWLGWALLWACIAASFHASLPVKALAVLLIDLAGMPLLDSAVTLHSGWQFFDAVMVLLCYVPGELLYRLTVQRRHRRMQNWLLGASFIGTFLYVLPAGLEAAGRNPSIIWERSPTQINVFAQGLILCLLPFFAAIQAFTRYGRGTPVPLDPAPRFIDRGVFSFLANPMQCSITVSLLLVALMLMEPLLILAAAINVCYSEGFARWSEYGFLSKRFGNEWKDYRRSVPRWIPRYRPYVAPTTAPAIIYFSRDCGFCSTLRLWLERQKPANLYFRDAEDHPRGRPDRLQYIDPVNGIVLEGVRAFSAGLNHVSLPYAFCGWFIDLPVIAPLVQLAVDVFVDGPSACPLPQEKRDESRSLEQAQAGKGADASTRAINAPF